ncbi:MAG: indolepyruvate oxidoreductase subunit beta [Planctomycetota bacterium]
MSITTNTINIILAGVGGQGILFATKILSAAAKARGMAIIGSETHGMAQRGGSVVSHLKLGGARSPLVRRGSADVLYALDPMEGMRALPFLKKGGTVFVNTGTTPWPDPALEKEISKLKISVAAFHADRIALEMKQPRLANVILIGFSSSHKKSPFAADELREALISAAPEKFKEMNLQAFEAGLKGA